MPGVPPLVGGLLLPPQRTCTKINPSSKRQSSTFARTRFLEGLNPAPINARPGIDSPIAYNGGSFRKSKVGLRFAVGATVVMVSVEVPDPPATATVLNEQVALDGSPEQESET